MSPRSALRSFAITLAIAITVFRQQVSGFTINRSNLTLSTTLPVSLFSDDSVQLQVKDDLRRPSADSTYFVESTTNGDSNKTMTSDSNKAITSTITKEKLPDVTKKQPPQTTLTTVEIRSTTEDTRIPTISSDTVEVFDSGEVERDARRSNKVVEHTKMTSIKAGASDSNKLLEISYTIKTTTDNLFQTTTDSNIMTTSTKNITQSTLDNGETPTNTLCDICGMTTESVEMSTTKSDDASAAFLTTENDRTVSETLLLSTIPSEDSNVSTELPYLSSTFSVSDMIQTTTDISSTEASLGKYAKYTNIVRKRVSNSEDPFHVAGTEDDTMTMKAETSNTHLSFDRMFDMTPIPSLKKFRVDLESNINQPLSGEMISEEVKKATGPIQPTLPTTTNTKETEAKRPGTLQTKRAGYLDFSEKATTPLDASFTSALKKEKDAETYGGVMEDSEATDTESPDFKKVSVKTPESQSQLAEDAILEELLKEEALSNHQENAIRYDRLDNKEAKSDVQESLSVQPINQERTKTTLYTVGPSYKPMKKIDVQPAKPFVRDPDDNSWRNESISSLGIVFKPKNSSKSFKEVLKNKTQTEFNNIQEKDNKENVPDLRVRLEKIAEVRKTKKKKLNKDGEEVYSDYEEGNSAETPKPYSMLSSVNNEGGSKLNTQANTEANAEGTTPTRNDFDTNNAKTTNKKLIYKDPLLDPLTTKNPKKLFNIAEYYDSTDEYDADYVTMSKIDIKKFTPLTSPHTTHMPYSIAPLLTRPDISHFPDRKPTVQYFPPRKPELQKVNVNNLDKDFERKINFFTSKDTAKIEPLPQFVTVPSVPIATEKPESEMRQSLRPGVTSDATRPDIMPTPKPGFMVYTPADLANNYYLTNAPRVTDPHGGFVINEGSLNRGSYVIKHYKDFLDAAAKDNDDEKRSDFLSYHTQTESPREVTFGAETGKTAPKGGEYDYDSQFRRDVLHRFVDNFNQNSERFKVDFPILFNSSIVHRKEDGSGHAPASSRVFLKRLYNEGAATTSAPPKSCEPTCDLTVELSPAYELHYYVPEQEERGEQPVSAATGAPYRYGL